MKAIIFLISLLFIVGCNDNNPIELSTAQSFAAGERQQRVFNDTVVMRKTNEIVTGNKLTVDIECKILSSSEFTMGSSTVTFDKSFLSNPVLSNVNPRYTVGGGSGYYHMMIGDYGENIVLQIIYLYEPGNSLQRDYERIATITMDIDAAHSFEFNDNLTYIINPEYVRSKVLFNPK